jgi:hypothetical protein
MVLGLYGTLVMDRISSVMFSVVDHGFQAVIGSN